MKKLLTVLTLISLAATITFANRKGSVILRFRTDKFDAMTAAQIELRKDMVSEIYGLNETNLTSDLHAPPPGWNKTNENALAEYRAYIDSGWTVCTQAVDGAWISDTNYPAVTNTAQWTCYHVSNQQTGGIADYNWAQKWRGGWTFLNPYFKIDIIE